MLIYFFNWNEGDGFACNGKQTKDKWTNCCQQNFIKITCNPSGTRFFELLEGTVCQGLSHWIPHQFVTFWEEPQRTVSANFILTNIR